MAAGSYQIVASHLGGVLKDTSLVTVTAPASPLPPPPSPLPDGLYPNRPADYTTVVSDYAFDGPLPANGASGAMPDGSGWLVINTSHYMTTVNDPTERIDGGNALDWMYDVHADNGLSTSYGHVNYPVPSGVTDWYVAFSIWHSANAQLNPVSNKLFEWLGQDPQGFGADFMIQTAGQDGFWEFNAQRVNPTAVKNSQRFLPNLSAGPSPKGQWVTVEILVHFGTTANFDCWLNGVHTHHYTGLRDIYIPSAGSEFTLNTTWGGAGGAITQAWHRRVGHILIAHP